MRQLDLFAATRKQPVSNLPDPAEIRARVQGLLAELVAAETMPWTEQQRLVRQVVLPQTTNWLGAEEREALLDEIDRQLIRLGCPPTERARVGELNAP